MQTNEDIIWSFKLGIMCSLRFHLWKQLRFGKKGKLCARYMGPFEIFEKIGNLAYGITLPPSLERIHNVFHISTLRKFVHDPSHTVELKPLYLVENLSYEEFLIWIVNKMDKVFRRAIVKLVKVQWRNHSEMEATWELKEGIKDKYPNIFHTLGT